MLSLRLLGPLEASHDGTPLDVGGVRPQVLLALLATARGRVVQRDRLIDALWEDNPPESAHGQISIHISALRKAVGAPLIETVSQGYRLRTDRIDLDVEEVERLTADDAETDRAQRLGSALELWRGRAMAGLSSAVLAPEVRRLEELRLDLIEEWAQLTLVRGGHRTVLELLAGEVGEHPLRERLRLRLMEALWAAGRRADALEAYRDGQKVLASELGLDPGQELQALHQQILREERPPRPLQGEDGWSAPHRLPIAPPRFVGRDTQLEDLDVLRRADDIDDHRPGAVIALHGTGGVGKTTLALHWAHAVADDFPDGQLFVNLRGHGPSDSLSVGDALDVLLRALGVEPSHIPDDEDDRGQLLRDRLAGRRLLIVLDNARDSDQVRPLLPGGRHLVLVTSRSQLRSLVAHNGARRIRVEPMGVDEAADLLADRLDGHRAFEEDRHRGALTDLASVCGHLPIALAVAAERAGRYDDLPLAALSAELRGDVAGTAPLDALATGADDRDTDVRAVLSWSYDALDDAAARQFRLLGLHPHPTYDAHAASWLAGLDLAAAKQVLDRLVEANLLVEIIPGEYEMHDLVRAFAMEVAHSEGRSEERTEAVARMRAGYAHSATNARTAFIRPHAWLDGGHLPAGVEPRAFSDGNDAASWVRERRHLLMDVVVAAAQDGDHDVVKNVFAQVDGVIQLTSNIAELLAWTTVALESALAAGDPAGEVLARSMLGMISLIEGRPEKAITDTSWCVAAARSFDISAPLEVVLLRHGLVLGHLGRHDDAVAANVEGAELADRAGRSPAVFHNNCAQGLMYLERYEEARQAATRAVESVRAEHGNCYQLAQFIDTQGEIALAAGDPSGATELFQQAVDTLRQSGAWDGTTANFLRNLGIAQRELGRWDEARASWETALQIVGVTDYAFFDSISRAELNDLITSLPTTATAAP